MSDKSSNIRIFPFTTDHESNIVVMKYLEELPWPGLMFVVVVLHCLPAGSSGQTLLCSERHVQTCTAHSGSPAAWNKINTPQLSTSHS